MSVSPSARLRSPAVKHIGAAEGRKRRRREDNEADPFANRGGRASSSGPSPNRGGSTSK